MPDVTRVSASQAGLSLVELMIAMTLGLLLMAGLTQIFVSNKQAFVTSQALASVQESGREAAILLARDIRNADYWGCLTRSGTLATNLNPVASGAPLDLEQGLHISEDTNSENRIVDGTHVATLRGVDSTAPVAVALMPAADAASLHLTDVSGVQVGDLLMVSDCKTAHIFQTTSVNREGNLLVHNSGGSVTPGNAVKTMPRKYSANARIYRPTVMRYSIQAQADGSRNLVLERLQTSANKGNAGVFGDPVEMVRGIRDLRTLIGVDDNGDGAVDVWQDPPEPDAAGASDVLARTLAVRISVLARSRDNQAADSPVSYCFPGWLTCTDEATGLTRAEDHAFYRAYTFATSVRNRTLGAEQ